MSQETGCASFGTGCAGCLILSAIGLFLGALAWQSLDLGPLLFALLVAVALWGVWRYQDAAEKRRHGPDAADNDSH